MVSLITILKSHKYCLKQKYKNKNKPTISLTIQEWYIGKHPFVDHEYKGVVAWGSAGEIAPAGLHVPYWCHEANPHITIEPWHQWVESQATEKEVLQLFMFHYMCLIHAFYA